MVTPQEIRTVTFERNMRGYRCEDVDDFLQRTADDMEALAGQVGQLTAAKEEADQKLYILAQKIEEYRKEEDTLKTALLNAQRMGENIIREARQKAESILREANIKAEDLTRSSKEQVEEQTLELERIQSEVARFKASVLSLYKQHIESLSTLPGEESKEPQPAEEPAEEPQAPTTAIEPAALPQAQPAPAAAAQPQPAEQPPQPEPQPAEEPAEEPEIWKVDFQPNLNAPQKEPGPAPEQEEDEDEEEAPAETMLFAPQPPAPAEEEGPLPSIFEGFQGIRFSD